MIATVYTTPNVVYVSSNKSVFMNYNGGVITSSTCGTTLDHGVLAVGYSTGTYQGDYWII